MRHFAELIEKLCDQAWEWEHHQEWDNNPEWDHHLEEDLLMEEDHHQEWVDQVSLLRKLNMIIMHNKCTGKYRGCQSYSNA